MLFHIATIPVKTKINQKSQLGNRKSSHTYCRCGMNIKQISLSTALNRSIQAGTCFHCSPKHMILQQVHSPTVVPLQRLGNEVTQGLNFCNEPKCFRLFSKLTAAGFLRKPSRLRPLNYLCTFELWLPNPLVLKMRLVLGKMQLG